MSGGKCFNKPEISNLPEDTTFIAGEFGHHFFATCIFHSYLRGQVVGLSNMGSTANDQINLTKTPKQAGVAH